MASDAYQALGVRILANFPLTLHHESTRSEADLPTLRVDLQEHTRALSLPLEKRRAVIARQTPDHPSIEVYVDGDEWALVCEHGERHACYRTRGDGHLRVEYQGLIPAADLAAPLEGPALGMALRRDGHTLLHASSVRLGSRGVAFCGMSGQGKSTLAAMMLAEGAQFWGDDILRIVGAGAFPDGRAARLYGDVAQQAGIDATTAPLAHLGAEKRKFDLVDERFLIAAHSLDAVFVLAKRVTSTTPVLTPLRGVDAIMALMYCRYPSWMRDPVLDAYDFDRLSTLAKSARVFQLQLPDGLAHMPSATRQLMDLIKEPSFSE